MKIALLSLLVTLSLGAKELKALNWNVFLLPGFVQLVMNTYQEERIPLIADFIKEGDYDVAALQEVFTETYYQKLKQRLKDRYPYDTGLPYRTWYKPVNSGLVIFSKYPLTGQKFYPFKRQRHADMFSSKGVQEVKVKVSEYKSFYMVNTHFQARTEHFEVRKDQLKLLDEQVLKDKRSGDQTVVVAGDFNINLYSEEYKSLLKSAKMRPMTLVGPLLFTTDAKLNTFKDDGRRELIDYIFVQSPKGKQKQRVLNPVGDYSDVKNGSLSDHMPIEAIIEI